MAWHSIDTQYGFVSPASSGTHVLASSLGLIPLNTLWTSYSDLLVSLCISPPGYPGGKGSLDAPYDAVTGVCTHWLSHRGEWMQTPDLPGNPDPAVPPTPHGAGVSV